MAANIQQFHDTPLSTEESKSYAMKNMNDHEFGYNDILDLQELTTLDVDLTYKPSQSPMTLLSDRDT